MSCTLLLGPVIPPLNEINVQTVVGQITVPFTYPNEAPSPTPFPQTPPASNYGLTDYALFVFVINDNNPLNPVTVQLIPNTVDPELAADAPVLFLQNGAITSTRFRGAFALSDVTRNDGIQSFSMFTRDVGSIHAGVTWFFDYDTTTGVLFSRKDPYALQICPRRNTVGISAPPPFTPEGTSISGTAFGTEDNKNICQVNITIVNPNLGCMHRKCQNMIEQILEYKLYCLDLIPVLRVKGKCLTLAQAVAQLQREGFVVTLEDLVRYSVIRLALSKLIFGCFNVQYLTRRYYTTLLEVVARCYPNFIQFFDGSNPDYPYEHYWRFFL